MSEVTELSTAADPAAARSGGPRLERWPAVAMVIAAAVLLAVYAYSQTVRMPYGLFSHLPIYGVWRPVLDPLALTVIVSGGGLAALTWAVVSSRRVSTPVALAAIIAAGVPAAATVGLVRGT